eukprot:snap_masked-scaffold_31-processed-gene-0.18-mRNA-1 protein AED:1.00 eAED:1.00 QI:0/-1/0/0/-1/1/1/0/194
MITDLKQQFEGDKAVDLQVTRIQLESFKLSSNVEASILKFKELHSKCLNFGGEIKDHELSELLIRKLPPSYNTMVANIRSNAVIQSSGKIQFNNLVSSIKLTSSTLYSSGNSKKKKFKQRNISSKTKKWCKYHKTLSHSTKKCIKLKNMRKNEIDSNNANVASSKNKERESELRLKGADAICNVARDEEKYHSF